MESINIKKAMYVPILLFVISSVLSFIFILMAGLINSELWTDFFRKMADASSFISAGTASAIVLVFVVELTKNRL